MSLQPIGIGYNHHGLVDQDFGLVLTPDDPLTAAVAPMLSRDQMAAAARDIGSTIKSEKDKFQVNLDVDNCTSEEIPVNTADGFVIVEGKHEEKQYAHGSIFRQFSRRNALPFIWSVALLESCIPERLQLKLSLDRVLSIVAPKVAPALKNERAVPIAQTGPVRKEIKDLTSEENENGVM